MNRVHRNFWVLVTATVVAVGLLSTAVRMPASPVAGALTALAGLAAAVSLALTGRILVVTTRRHHPIERQDLQPEPRPKPSGMKDLPTRRTSPHR